MMHQRPYRLTKYHENDAEREEEQHSSNVHILDLKTLTAVSMPTLNRHRPKFRTHRHNLFTWLDERVPAKLFPEFWSKAIRQSYLQLLTRAGSEVAKF